MTATVLICTKDRRDRVALTLDGVSKLTYDGDWEIILVDNGSRDDTLALLHQFAAAAPRPCTVLSQPVTGSARCRNAGLLRARGDLIAFLDDDCIPAPDWLTRIVATFAEFPDVGYLGGRIELYDQRDDPITTKTEPEPQRFPPHSVLPTGSIHGANMAYRRTLIEAVGGFNPAFGAGGRFSGEDVEYCTRASIGGWAGRYEPSAVVYHNHGRRSKWEVRRLSRRYDVGRGAYYARFIMHPRSRSQAMHHWYWHWWRVSWLTVAREIWGAVSYTLLQTAGMLPAVPKPLESPHTPLSVARVMT